jgi:hypothetical protein
MKTNFGTEKNKFKGIPESANYTMIDENGTRHEKKYNFDLIKFAYENRHNDNAIIMTL